MAVASGERTAPWQADWCVSGGRRLASRYSYMAGQSVWRDSILFLEASEDQRPRVALRCMLRALAATGAFREGPGILYGRRCDDESKFEAYDAVLLVVLSESGLTRFR